MTRKILITGITGQDGPYLAKQLIEEGCDVIGTHRRESNPFGLKYLNIAKQVTLINVDFTNILQVESLVKRERFDEIYHLAAQSSVGYSFKHPQKTIEFNIMSTVNLLEAIKNASPYTKFYQSSSSEMYGHVESLPVTEKSSTHPVSPYAISKQAAHKLTIQYREAYGIFACCGILFNHESFLRKPQFVTKKIVQSAVRIFHNKQQTLLLGNLNIKRDWGFAPEYTRLMTLILSQDAPDDYIAATGKSYSLRRFVKEVFDTLDLNWKDYVQIDASLFRPAEIIDITGDASKARNKLNWNYTLSFEELVKTLVHEELAFHQSSVANG